MGGSEAEEVACPQCEGLGCGKYAPRIPCSRCGGRGTVEAWTLDESEREEETDE